MEEAGWNDTNGDMEIETCQGTLKQIEQTTGLVIGAMSADC